MDRLVKIVTERFILRNLTEKDVTERYLSWLDDTKVKKNITAAIKTKNLSDLKQYVRDKIGNDDILFLSIFEKTSGLHIGNIKYEPVNSELGYAIMGILIGDLSYQGKGVASEVIIASANWLKYNMKIKTILLGVSINNDMAICAYRKVGFVFSKTEFIPNHPSTMVLDLLNLRQTFQDNCQNL
ncbi:MAG: GNAT family N-acetyltransferase [Desulfobacterales bacterium]|nr:GNAT family N-acetyltransferase [Desulfobacterales bacterium]